MFYNKLEVLVDRHHSPAVLAQLVAQLPACLVLVTAADRLPDPLASHFALDGTADGFTGHGWLLVVLLGLAGSLAVVSWATLNSPHVPGRRVVVGASWATATLLGVVTWSATAANLDLADAADAVLPPWWFAVGLGAGAVVGAVAYRFAPPSPPAGRTDVMTPAVRLGATEQVSWSRTATSRVGVAAAVVLTVAGIGTAVAGLPLVAPVALLVAAAALAVATTARVTVDRRGLRVGLGPLGWPRLVVPVEDIRSAAVGEVSPAEFGGWGYRIVPGARGVILRGGPALLVTRRSGARLVVTVDDPGTAAGLLAGMVRSGGPGC
ncbi:hypothetical protein [Pseudonocardia abyssalis]|uniref:DUF1648 domain-containing protein n=1 Tax=Pseudonocardia abyssalis TaxID=2792008 RepID=A0ABS6UXB9_9PSEU|nr:hypothetical protein [Pseudonocardia abyssalis]MBW0118008.1 hypothetical protein [Pseudonocardia abyssalis]MBW0136887.1 hypothetical protein [Pseudonocardia abyssalis]